MPMPDSLVGICDTLTWHELNQRGYFDSELETALEKYLAERKMEEPEDEQIPRCL